MVLVAEQLQSNHAFFKDGGRIIEIQKMCQKHDFW